MNGTSVRERIVNALFGDVVEARVREAVKVVDDKWWTQLGGAAGTNDLPWAARQQHISDALDAWRDNPMARQIIRLQRGYVLQDGIRFRSDNPDVQRFVDEFWNHRQNRMPRRMRRWCDALALFGEIFPVLYVNRGDGMVYVRSIPARSIDDVETDADDLERERRFHQLVEPQGTALGSNDTEGRWWRGHGTLPLQAPLMLHFAVNKVEGAVRGSGDLDAGLRWMRGYDDFLWDRWTINRVKGRYVWDLTVEGADARQLKAHQLQLEKAAQGSGGIFVHNDKMSIKPQYPGIAADSVADDGRSFRLMVAASAGMSLHHFGEGDSANRASSESSDRAMTAHFHTRQQEMCDLGIEIIEAAAGLASDAGAFRMPGGGLELRAEVQELDRGDNLALAQAGAAIAQALVTAKEQGWIDDATARRLFPLFIGGAAEPA